MNRRKRQDWDSTVLEHLAWLRGQHPALGFEKLHIFLLDWCEPRGLLCPSVSTLRRLAKSDKRLMPVKHRPAPSTRMKAQGQRRPKGCRPKAPGECVGVDTIEIHGGGIYSGLRRYVVTSKDMHSRFALGAAVPSKHKCPKMNAHAERFNRSIQEEFIEFHKDLLFQNLHAFNDKLLDYLIWFNESRPHYALGLRSPMQFLAEEHQRNMYWWDTNS